MESENTKQFILVTCKRCGYNWNYKGKKVLLIKDAEHKILVSCPTCYKLTELN